jgi:hypothetical protein
VAPKLPKLTVHQQVASAAMATTTISLETRLMFAEKESEGNTLPPTITLP